MRYTWVLLAGLLSACGEDVARTDYGEELRDLRAQVADLRAQLAQARASEGSSASKLAVLEASNAFVNKLQGALSVDEQGDLIIEGINVYIRNGAGETLSANGKGNLILGYDETSASPERAQERTGSHNLIIGKGHSWTKSAGLVAGLNNRILADGAVALGAYNEASGKFSTVAGGQKNVASGESSSVNGGGDNAATALFSTVAGGASNVASGESSAVAGGGRVKATRTEEILPID